MKLFLDTQVFIWMDDDYSQIPAPIIEELENKENLIFLSLVSIWEAQIKI